MKTVHIFFRPAFGRLLLSAALLANLSVGFVGIRSLADSREATVRLAEVRSRNLANSADQNITAMLNRIDHTLLSVAGSMEREMDSGDQDSAHMKHILVFEEKYLPEAAAIRVTNSDGTVILNHASDSPGTLADRSFFAYLKDHPGAGLFVTKPVQGLFTEKWAVPCARRYNLPDGRFGGIVVALLLVEQFENALGGYDVGPGGLRTVRYIDGGFIARYPAVVKDRTLPVGDKTISVELQALIRSEISQETFFSTTPYDQTKRTVTFRRMKAAPLIVVAGLAEEDYLSQWYKDRKRTLAVVAAFIVGTWIMAGLLWRSWKGRESDAEIIKESEMKYRSLVETAQELVWKCDVQGRFTYLNPAWEKTHGYRIEEMLGRGFGEFQRPEIFERDKKEFVRELAGESVIMGYETTHIAKDGRELTLLFNVVPEVNARGEIIGTQGTAIDITERKLAEDALKKEKGKLRKYLDISAVVVVILDADRKVVLINKRGCEILGYAEEEIVGRDWFETFLPEKARDEARKTFSKLMSGNIEPVEYYENEILTSSGDERLIAWYNTALRDEKDNIIGTLSSGGDITERKMAVDKIRASLKEKELLLREIHHRVKNNMQVISSLLSLQTVQIKDSKYAEIFNETKNRLKTMSLVHEKLYMSEDLASIDFQDYVKDLSESLFSAYQTTAPNISLHIEAEDVLLNVDTAIPCGLVINELLSNSLKHAFPGGRKGEINVYLGKALDEGKTVYDLTVSDNGVGIPEEIDIRKTASLGLQLVTTLAEHQLRGTVDLDRTEGTKFHIRFREISYGRGK